MKYLVLSASLLTVAACGGADDPVCCAIDEPILEDAPVSLAAATLNEIAPPAPALAPNGYDDTWSVTEDLPGEWPLGLAILKDDVTLQGRAALDPDAPANIACPLPKLMSVHQWNLPRTETENWRFASAEKLTRIEATTGFTLADDFDNGGPITIASGDIGIFKAYHAEGIFTSTWNGRDFVSYLEDFEGKAKFEQGPPADLWVNVRCYDGADTRAWIDINDALEVEGVSNPPHTYFGVMTDIEPEQIDDLLRQSAPTEAADIEPYPPTQYTITPFWSGEYPNAFAIVRGDITLLGRSKMNPFIDADVTCKMPHKATYSPWNADRNLADDIAYETAVPIRTITINEDLNVEALTRDSGDAAQLTLGAGDTLQYINYLSEGWFVAEYQGTEYEMNESDLFAGDNATMEDGGRVDEWVQVQCENGPRAWLRYSDVIKTFGVRRYDYTGYGEAADLP